MKEVVILGAGNVATHLFKAFQASAGAKVLQVYNRSEENLDFFRNQVAVTSNLKEIVAADFYILALSDDAIKEIVPLLPEQHGIVVHTSGAKGISTLSKFENYGVFYPLQSFSKSKEVDFHEIPICLEANSPTVLIRLKELASEISEKIYEVDSDQRKALHVAAVFANNFTNHMYSMAAEICARNGLQFEVLRPLIRETLAKAEVLPPPKAQTGPALRGDSETISAHLELLNKDEQEIYKLITSSIQKLHGKKL